MELCSLALPLTMFKESCHVQLNSLIEDSDNTASQHASEDGQCRHPQCHGSRELGLSQASIVPEDQRFSQREELYLNRVFGSCKRAFRWRKVIGNKDSKERKLSRQRISRKLVSQKLRSDRRPWKRILGWCSFVEKEIFTVRCTY